VGKLPLFHPDADPARIDVVAEWVREVRVADGIVVSTPEYARGYPGALKNAFDWLVGTDAFIEKPFMLLTANPRSTVAQDTLTVVLETMSGRHVASASTIVPLLGTTLTVADIVEHREFAKRIQEALSTFVSALR
jgi:NAD(P)H-dependent FMN reductase